MVFQFPPIPCPFLIPFNKPRAMFYYQQKIISMPYVCREFILYMITNQRAVSPRMQSLEHTKMFHRKGRLSGVSGLCSAQNMRPTIEKSVDGFREDGIGPYL